MISMCVKVGLEVSLVLSSGRSDSYSSALVVVGTFFGPVAQWVVFFMVARVGGDREAGAFALLLAVATPLVTASSWGLRNGYITLPSRYGFVHFVVLRIVGVLISSVVIVTFGVIVESDAPLLIAVVLMKAADSVIDIWFGRWQRQGRLWAFGSVMVLNGLLTVVFAGLLALSMVSAGWVVVGSALGSICSLCVVLLIDSKDIWFGFRDGALVDVDRRTLLLILRSCWPICAGQTVVGVMASMPTWLVGWFGDPGEVGRFAAAAYLITLGSVLGASLNSVALGKYHFLMASRGKGAVRSRAQRASSWVTLVCLCLAAGLGLFSGPLFEIVYGKEFALTSIDVAVVAIAAALIPGTFLLNAALLACNAYRTQMFVGIASLGLSVGIGLLVVGLHFSGFMVGAVCALSGSIFRYLLSVVSIDRVARTR